MPYLLRPSRTVVIVALLAFAAVLVAVACSRTGRSVETGPAVRLAVPAARPEPPAEPEPPAVDFATDVQPILEAGCRPCHFAGGVMHEKLPFDRPETIRQLGEKLFTRIDEPEDQTTIRAFLEAEAEQR